MIANVNPTKKKQLEITSRDIRPKNVLALRNHLKTTDNQLPLIGDNASEQFDNFHTHLQNAIEHFLPIKTRMIPARSTRREAWMTAGLLYCTRKNKQLYKKMIKDRNNEVNRVRYHDYNRLLQRIKRSAKCQFYYDKCCEHRNNTSKLWKTVNEVVYKTNNKSEVIEKLKVNNLNEYKGDLIAEEFARYFASIGEIYAQKMPMSRQDLQYYLNRIQRNQMSIFLTPVTSQEIKKHINNLKPKKSSGLDNIDNILLKELRDVICEPLVTIFNNSISEGIFPDKMKPPRLCPLHKSGPKDETTNYRPISLLLTISKILEKIMYTRVYQFLNETNQLYGSQYGFRKTMHVIKLLVN